MRVLLLLSHERTCSTGKLVGSSQGINQRYWLSDDSISWGRNPCVCPGKIAIDGSLRGIARKYVACGWAVMQMEQGRDLES